MAKRVILLTVTMALVIAVFLIYRNNTRKYVPPMLDEQDTSDNTLLPHDNPARVEMIDTGMAMTPGEELKIGHIEGPRYTKRDKTGRVTWQFGFDERLSERKDTFEIRNPWAKFYTRDGRIIEIHAPLGTMPLEFVNGQLQEPSSGSLKGGVTIELSHRLARKNLPAQPAAALASDKQPKTSSGPSKLLDMRIKLDSIVFEREFSQVSSSGKVSIQGDLFSVTGRDLTFQYDQVNERLQELILRQVGEMRSRLALDAMGKKTSSRPAAAPTHSASTTGTPPLRQPARSYLTYAFSLTNHVIIRQDQDKLAADKIDILAHISGSKSFMDNKITPAGPTTHVASANKTAPAGSLNQKPIPTTAPETVITCNGPLTIRYLDDKNPQALSNDYVEFVAYGKPVEIYQTDKIISRADQVQFNTRDETLKLVSASAQPVWMYLDKNQAVTAKRGITFERKTSLTTLFGPGTVTIPDAEKQVATINYLDRLYLQTITRDNSRPDTSPFADRTVQWLEFKGRLHSVSPNGHFQADSGRITFYPPASQASSGDSFPPLKTIILNGNIKIADPCSLFTCSKTLSADFSLNPVGQSYLKSFHAQGDIHGENNDYLIEAKDAIAIDLFMPTAAQPGSSSGRPAAIDNNKNAASAIFSRLFARIEPRHILAKGKNSNVHIVNKKDKYQIRGDRIEGFARQGSIQEHGLWTIWGSPARITLAQQGELTGKQITVDPGNQYCDIPGAGSMTIITDSDLTGTHLRQPLPVTISWLKNANYHLRQNKVIFQDVTVNLIQRQQDSLTRNLLTAPTITISLVRNTAGNSPANSQIRQKLSAFTASGPQVALTSAKTDLHNRLLSRMQLACRKIRFLNASSSPAAPGQTAGHLIVNGEGYIEVIDYQGGKTPAAPPNTKSLSGLIGGSISSSGPGYTLIHFLDELDYDMARKQVRFDRGVALHHIPLPDSKYASLQDNITKKNITDIKGYYGLFCNTLVVQQGINGKQLNTAAETGFSFQDVAFLQAEGDVTLQTVDSDNRKHIFTSNILKYSGTTHILTVIGDESHPARYDQTQWLSMSYNLQTESIVVDTIGQSILANQK